VPDARVAILSVLLLFGFAVAAWVFVPALRGREAAQKDLGSHRLALGTVVVVFLLNGLLTLPLAPFLRGGSTGLTTGTFLLAALATQIPMFLVVYFRLVVPGAMTWEDLGIKLLPIDRIFGVGLLTGFAGLTLTIVLDAGLSQVGLRQNQLDQFRFIRGEGLSSFVLVLLVGVVMAPCVEELFFRGFLFGTYREHKPLWVAYGASGLIFAVLHLDPNNMAPTQMAALAIGIFVLGTLLAFTYQRTGSLLPGMLAHALNNAVGLIAFYAFGAT
jgi:membrane protease YdiL (CAAX protease family)